MEFAFISRRLRELCEDDHKAEKEFGKAVTETLKARLADLRAAEGVQDLVTGNPRVIANDDFCMDLSNGYHLVFRANHVNNPTAKSGLVNWPKVRRIKIMKIGKGDD